MRENEDNGGTPKIMIKANEAHINLLARNDLDIDTLKNSINKADQDWIEKFFLKFCAKQKGLSNIKLAGLD